MHDDIKESTWDEFVEAMQNGGEILEVQMMDWKGRNHTVYSKEEEDREDARRREYVRQEEKKKKERINKIEEANATLAKELKDTLKKQREAVAIIRKMICINDGAIAIVTIDGNVVTSGLPLDLKRVVESWKNIKQVCMTISPNEQYKDVNSVWVAGLKEDGTVVYVGNNGMDPIDVSSWKDITQISDGWRNLYGIDKNGKVFASGTNYEGQLEVRNWTGIERIISDTHKVAAIKKDGKVIYGGKYDTSEVLTKVNANYVDIAYVELNTYGGVYGLTDGGKVVSAYNDDGTSEWENIICITHGIEDSHGPIAVTSDGKVKANWRGENSVRYSQINSWSNIVYAAAYGKTVIGITSDGKLKIFGTSVDPEMMNAHLFDNYLTIEEDRKRYFEEIEERRIKGIEEEIENLKKQIANANGLFSGIRKKKMESQIAELKKKLYAL